MPCYNGGNHNEDYIRQAEERLSERKIMPCRGPDDDGPSVRTKTVYRDTSKTISLLCSACRALEEAGFDFALNPRLDEWWDEHKAADARRIKKENMARLVKERAAELAKKPFNKLTATEKKILKDEGYFN